MWCRNCNIETNAEVCPVCGSTTAEDTPVEVQWCSHCAIPVVTTFNQPDKNVCPLCGGKTKYISTDLRPVFPEERLLIEILLKKVPNFWKDKSVWACNNRYYVDGKSIIVPNSIYEINNPDEIASQLQTAKGKNSSEAFIRYIGLFVQANRRRLAFLKDEAYQFIQHAADSFDPEQIVVSFSGGKDSTVTADLAIKALSNPSLVHIFGDTTLEFPSTSEYAERYHLFHPEAIFQIARNDDQNFYDVCDDIGPPARMMRWCCSMFKTGPITRIINSLYGSEQILTFYGIRKSESVSRSKYNRIEDSADAVKIKQQTVASPSFFGRTSKFGSIFWPKVLILTMPIVLVTIVLAAGAALTIISVHSSCPVFICRKKPRRGAVFSWILPVESVSWTQRSMWTLASGKRAREGMAFPPQMM